MYYDIILYIHPESLFSHFNMLRYESGQFPGVIHSSDKRMFLRNSSLSMIQHIRGENPVTGEIRSERWNNRHL